MMEQSLNLITAVVGIVGAVGLLALLYRKRQKQSTLLQLMAYQSLGAKKGVAALKVGQELLLIGVMPGGLRVLKTLKAEEVLKEEEAVFSERWEKLRKLKEEIHE
jgi:flagellar biogenesis protein FliO